MVRRLTYQLSFQCQAIYADRLDSVREWLIKEGIPSTTIVELIKGKSITLLLYPRSLNEARGIQKKMGAVRNIQGPCPHPILKEQGLARTLERRF